MNLSKKKMMAARTLKVGKGKIVFVKSRLDEIEKAVTKQDIRDLIGSRAIFVKEIKGRMKKVKKKKKRTVGNVRKKVNKRKQKYVKLTRKLRVSLAGIKEKLSRDEVKDIRKKIKNKIFRSLSHFKEYLGGLKK